MLSMMMMMMLLFLLMLFSFSFASSVQMLRGKSSNGCARTFQCSRVQDTRDRETESQWDRQTDGRTDESEPSLTTQRVQSLYLFQLNFEDEPLLGSSGTIVGSCSVQSSNLIGCLPSCCWFLLLLLLLRRQLFQENTSVFRVELERWSMSLTWENADCHNYY